MRAYTASNASSKAPAESGYRQAIGPTANMTERSPIGSAAVKGENGSGEDYFLASIKVAAELLKLWKAQSA